MDFETPRLPRIGSSGLAENTSVTHRQHSFIEEVDLSRNVQTEYLTMSETAALFIRIQISFILKRRRTLLIDRYPVPFVAKHCCRLNLSKMFSSWIRSTLDILTRCQECLIIYAAFKTQNGQKVPRKYQRCHVGSALDTN